MKPSDQKEIPVERLVDWPNPPTINDLLHDYDQAKVDAAEQILKIDKWLDLLHVRNGAKFNSGNKNKSSVQPKLIRKQAEWRYCSLSQPFITTQDLFKVSPATWADKKAAEQNQLILNYQFSNSINKVKFIGELVRTLVDEGTVFLRVGWVYEDEPVIKKRPLYRVDPINDSQALEEFSSMAEMAQQEPERFSQEVDPAVQMAIQQFMKTGQAAVYTQVGEEEYEDVNVIRNEPTLEVCDYRNLVCDPTCNGDLSKARFVIYSYETSVGDLRKDARNKNLDHIEIDANSVLNSPDKLVNNSSTFAFKDNERKKIVCREYWGFWDYDGSGIPKPFVAAWVGKTLIRMDKIPFPDNELPFINIQYMPVRKSLYGEPDSELLADNQAIIGAVTRGMVDIMARSANGQTGILRGALDVTNRRKYDKGADYEFNSIGAHPRDMFYMHTYPEIPNSAQFMLSYHNADAESLTGVKNFSEGISANAFGDVAAGIRGVLDASSKREMDILNRVADGIIQAGKKIIAMNAEFLSDEEVIRITDDEFVTINREELGGKFDLKLSISTAEQDNKKAQDLAFVLQTVTSTMGPDLAKLILADIARLQKMPDLAKKLEEYTPQVDPVQQELAQLEVELKKKQLEEIQARIISLTAQAELTTAKTDTEEYVQQDLNASTDLKTLDFVEQESGVKQERELQKQGEQAKANAKLEVVKHQLSKNSPEA